MAAMFIWVCAKFGACATNWTMWMTPGLTVSLWRVVFSPKPRPLPTRDNLPVWLRSALCPAPCSYWSTSARLWVSDSRVQPITIRTLYNYLYSGTETKMMIFIGKTSFTLRSIYSLWGFLVHLRAGGGGIVPPKCSHFQVTFQRKFSSYILGNLSF